MWSTWNGIIRKFNREVKKKDVVEKLNDMEIEIEKLQEELDKCYSEIKDKEKIIAELYGCVVLTDKPKTHTVFQDNIARIVRDNPIT